MGLTTKAHRFRLRSLRLFSGFLLLFGLALGAAWIYARGGVSDKLVITDSNNQPLAAFHVTGDLALKGELTTSSMSISPSGSGEWYIEQGGDVLALLDTAGANAGDLAIKGSIYESRQPFWLEYDAVYEVRLGAQNELVAVVDTEGNLILAGDLYENAAAPDMQRIVAGDPPQTTGTLYWRGTAFSDPWLDITSKKTYVAYNDNATLLSHYGDFTGEMELDEDDVQMQLTTPGQWETAGTIIDYSWTGTFTDVSCTTSGIYTATFEWSDDAATGADDGSLGQITGQLYVCDAELDSYAVELDVGDTQVVEAIIKPTAISEETATITWSTSNTTTLQFVVDGALQGTATGTTATIKAINITQDGAPAYVKVHIQLPSDDVGRTIAFERQISVEIDTRILHVKTDGNDNNDGTSWYEAFATIQGALNASQVGDEIWVKKGAYQVSDSVEPTTGVLLYGGFFGNELQYHQRDSRNWANNPTTITMTAANKPVIDYTAGVTLTRLDGFVITGGDVSSGTHGAGVSMSGATSNTLANCRIVDNVTSDTATHGAGMALLNDSEATLINCTITGNESSGAGGGIYLDDSTVKLSECEISDNTAAITGGAGFYASEAKVTIEESAVLGNETDANYGGGLYLADSEVEITTTTIGNNEALKQGGGLYLSESGDASREVRLAYCTIAGNEITATADVEKGGAGIWIAPSTSASGKGNVWITESAVSGNWIAAGGSNVHGGGIAVRPGVNVWLINDVISGNGIKVSSNNDVISGCGVSLGDNATSGGLRYLTNCTISQNYFENSGSYSATMSGGLYIEDDSGTTTTIENVIIENHAPHNAYVHDGASSTSPVLANDPTACLDEGDSLNFIMNGDLGATGSWTTTPTLTAYHSLSGRERTTLTDSSASFTTGALVGLLLIPDASQKVQALITDNTATTIKVAGDMNDFGVAQNDQYRLIDYHLQYDSDAVDHGDAEVSLLTDNDRAGIYRPRDGDNSGSAEWDFGAYEYYEKPLSFNSDPLSKPLALFGETYGSASLSANVANPAGDPLYFLIDSGPDWLDVASATGALSSASALTSATATLGVNSWTVGVKNYASEQSSADEAELQIIVDYKLEFNPDTLNLPFVTANTDYGERNKKLSDYLVNQTHYSAWVFSKESGPAWLTVDSATGALSGSTGSNGSYQWTVKVVSGAQSDTATVNITVGDYDDENPSAPQNLTAWGEVNSVQLDWGDNTEWDILGYDIYRCPTETGTYVKINGASPVSGSAYLDDDASLTVGEDYYYKVKAVDGDYNASDYSSWAKAAPLSDCQQLQPPKWLR